MVEPQRAPAPLTVGHVVTHGAVVGIDDSDLDADLLRDLVAAGPALIGTASLASLLVLTASRAARTGQLRVRLFGGLHHPTAGAFTGSQGVRAVTATRCDVALVAGRLVGRDVWVPSDVRDGRLALLLAAHRAYLVPTTGADPASPDHRSWSRLAPVADFDGVLDRSGRRAARTVAA